MQGLSLLFLFTLRNYMDEKIQIVEVPINELRAAEHNPHKHSKELM